MLRNQNLVAVQSLSPLIRTTNTAINGTSADLSAVDAVTILFPTGVITDGTHTTKLQESDDNSSFSDVAAGDIVGTAGLLVAATCQTLVYKGAKRYVRPVVTTAGATSGASFAALILKGHNFASDG